MRQNPKLIAAVVAAAVVLLAAGPAFLPPFYVRVGQLMLYSAGLGLAWAILGGFAGYASFGHSAFIGIGAFAAGLVENQYSSLPPVLLLPLGLVTGGLCCAILSAVIAYPILRLRGTFFAIAMLGVSHVGAEVTNNIDFFQGALGLNFPPLAPVSMDPAVFFYELFLAGALLILLISWLIRRSRFGAGLFSIREDEDTARMLGVPTERYKRVAFVVSAVLTGLMGVIYAHSLGYITTDSVYRDDTNLNLIVYSLLGGMGTLFGPVVGAALVVTLESYLAATSLPVPVVIGCIFVVCVLLFRRGIVGELMARLPKRGH